MGSVLGSQASDSSQSPPVQLRIDLPQIVLRSANPMYHGDKEVFRKLTLLMQNGHSRLSFVSENVLAVYFNRPPEQTNEGTSATYPMEVFFVSTDSGRVIEHRTWSTLKRQWFNDSYDTEGRILEVRSGLSRLKTAFMPEDVQYWSYVDIWLPIDTNLVYWVSVEKWLIGRQ